MGVVTGLVMEFQFGMNWSEYARFVGDVFGAPLAIEALLAFFLEATFLGIWIFGWDKLSKSLHAAAMWMVAIGSNMSALWILIANAWMQNPVGAKGIGEPLEGCASSALVCAISDALGGHYFNRTPVVPDMIINAASGRPQSHKPLQVNTD